MSDLLRLFDWLTLGIWLLWFLLYWRGGARAVADIQKSVHGVSRLDTGLLLIIAGGSLMLVASGLSLALGWLVAGRSVGLTAGGAVLTAVGVGGTFYCRRYLGTMWTAETALQPAHHIIDRGPYGVVRHPIYTSAVILYVGLALTYAAWWTALPAVVVVAAYVLKARLEDGFLADQLPGYRAYQAKVRFRLIPGVW